MRWQSCQGWHLSQKSRILLFSSFDGLLWRPCYHLPEKKLTLNNAVCSAICNQPTRLVLNLFPFGWEGFCQLTCYCNASFWANFLSKFFFEYFFNILKLIFRNFFLGFVTLRKSTSFKNLILTVCLEKLVLSSASLLIFTKCS